MSAWLFAWAWGRKSASDIVRDAHAYVLDNSSAQIPVPIKRLAKTWTNIKNAERVVESLLPKADLVDIDPIDASCVDGVLLPYNTFHWLRTKHPRKFCIHMGAPQEGIQGWWEQLAASTAGQQFWQLHPWLKDRCPADLRFHLPLMVFDDAGPVTNSCSTYVRLFYSILGVGSEKETRLLMSSSFTNRVEQDKSWQPIMDSFEKLSQPVSPGTWGGILLFLGSDLDYVCNTMGLPHFNGVEQMCSLCLANRTTLPFTILGEGAPWAATCVDNGTFLARLRQPLHPAAGHPWFNLHTYRHDLLHMLDHHGLASHVIANILWAHLSGDREVLVLPGANMAERLAFLNDGVQGYYDHNRIDSRLPRLKESNIKDSDWPELKGNDVKAANTKAFVPYIVALQHRAVEQQRTQKNVHMLKVAQSLQACYDIMYAGSYFLDKASLKELQAHLSRFARHYQWLAVDAMHKGQTRWNIVPKFHFVLGHLVQQAELINPRFVQAYMSESMVGVVTELMGMCVQGPYKDNIQKVALAKYRLGLDLLMSQ